MPCSSLIAITYTIWNHFFVIWSPKGSMPDRNFFAASSSYATYTREKFITYDYVVNSIVLENLRSSNFVISQIKKTKFLFHKGTITIDWFWFNFSQMDIIFKYKMIKKSGLSRWKWVVLFYELLVLIIRNEFLAGVIMLQ